MSQEWSDYQTTLDCYLVPYFGPRKYDSITRLDIEKFRAEMVVGVPESVQRARDEKLCELKLSDPDAKLGRSIRVHVQPTNASGC